MGKTSRDTENKEAGFRKRLFKVKLWKGLNTFPITLQQTGWFQMSLSKYLKTGQYFKVKLPVAENSIVTLSTRQVGYNVSFSGRKYFEKFIYFQKKMCNLQKAMFLMTICVFSPCEVQSESVRECILLLINDGKYIYNMVEV